MTPVMVCTPNLRRSRQILQLAEGVATRNAVETNVEDRTTITILGNLLSNAENVATNEKGNITARNAKQVEMLIR